MKDTASPPLLASYLLLVVVWVGRVLVWPITIIPAWRRYRTYVRRADGETAARMAGIERGPRWTLTFAPPRFFVADRTVLAPRSLDLDNVLAAHVTAYNNHHRGFHNTTRHLHLDLRLRDGSRLSLFEAARGDL